MRANTAEPSLNMTPKGVLIFLGVTTAVVGALWWAAENGARGRVEQASLDAAAITAENTEFCAKHVADPAVRAGCVADLAGVRDKHLKRFTDSTADWF